MNGTTKLGLGILAAALVLGVLGDGLFRVGPPGLNGALWIGALVGSLWLITRLGKVEVPAEGRWLLLAAVGCATLLLWRDSEFLMMLDVLAVALCLGLAAYYARAGGLRRAGFLEMVLGAVLTGLESLYGSFTLVLGEISWGEMFHEGRSQRAVALGRGLLISLPLLLIFGALFANADAVFARVVTTSFRWDIGPVLSHLIPILIWGGLSAGFLRLLVLGKGLRLPTVQRPATVALGPVETGTILGLLNLLFLVFVVIQFRYLFGGSGLVQATTVMTYAEYARRGFFELVAVVALVIPVLLVGHWFQPDGAQRLFRWLAGGLLLQVLVVMASALQRMYLYVQTFGLTELRLYATALMGWLALLIFWFGATVLRGRRERFAFGALVAGFAVLFALHAINPDRLIAETNLARAVAGESLDGPYLSRLSADAVPALVEAVPSLPPIEKQALAAGLLARWAGSSPDWRTWNAARAQARAAVAADHSLLEASAQKTEELLRMQQP